MKEGTCRKCYWIEEEMRSAASGDSDLEAQGLVNGGIWFLMVVFLKGDFHVWEQMGREEEVEEEGGEENKARDYFAV